MCDVWLHNVGDVGVNCRLYRWLRVYAGGGEAREGKSKCVDWRRVGEVGVTGVAGASLNASGGTKLLVCAIFNGARAGALGATAFDLVKSETASNIQLLIVRGR